MKYSTECLGYGISAEITFLDDGADIGLTGGCRTHVGAVTLAEPDGASQTLLRKDHRDDVISRRWAAVLAEAWHMPVCVRCGIHYDGASKEQIGAIVESTEALLQRILREKTGK